MLLLLFSWLSIWAAVKRFKFSYSSLKWHNLGIWGNYVGGLLVTLVGGGRCLFYTDSVQRHAANAMIVLYGRRCYCCNPLKLALFKWAHCHSKYRHPNQGGTLIISKKDVTSQSQCAQCRVAIGVFSRWLIVYWRCLSKSLACVLSDEVIAVFLAAAEPPSASSLTTSTGRWGSQQFPINY